MTRAQLEQGPQLAMFDHNYEPIDQTQERPQPSPVAQAYLDAKAEGVLMTDLLQRAVRLKAALTEMGRMSSIEFGFVTAVDTASGDPIRALYGNGTRIVERRASDKLKDREKIVQGFLGRAMSYQALRSAQPPLSGKRELDKRAIYSWKMFDATFRGPPNAERRVELRRKLARQITQQKRLTRKNSLPIPESIDTIVI